MGWLLPAALLLEPVRNTLAYGQINIVLMALVALDCLTEAPRWPRGALIGLAAAVKLTPAAFVLFFLLRRDYRAAAAAGVSFAAATAAGFVLAGHDSVRYWTAAVFQTGRIGNPATPANQCLQAVLARAGLGCTPRAARPPGWRFGPRRRWWRAADAAGARGVAGLPGRCRSTPSPSC